MNCHSEGGQTVCRLTTTTICENYPKFRAGVFAQVLGPEQVT